MPSFGETLREKRREAGVSQREMADKVGVDFSYISKLENDRLPPPAGDTIVAICAVLEIEPAELLAMTGKLPSEVQESLASSKAAQEFLLDLQRMNLSEEEWEEMRKSLHQLRDDNP